MVGVKTWAGDEQELLTVHCTLVSNSVFSVNVFGQQETVKI